MDPQHVLQAQEFGGRRRDKRSEVVLRWSPLRLQTERPVIDGVAAAVKFAEGLAALGLRTSS